MEVAKNGIEARPFHPNIMIPMKLASSMKAIAAHIRNMCPKKSPPAREKKLQFVPN